MTIRQFFIITFICAFETYFFNDALLSGNYLFATFWGFLLVRDLRKAYNIQKFTQSILKATKVTKKKD
ncbi:hypothetical protein AT575_04975 [Streptococcus penaeicida]|uniref:DUF3272 domain-containing protein n=1 Tax=Streptococcus penaeicida TaxID=1765960 RepID=A0A2N8LC64_9STRE|nr:DUF3272 family protein [Streptococcus penaeicida]PND47749.1 hypothetical protein AT575_04975 [Streptococcus penaeicida]